MKASIRALKRKQKTSKWRVQFARKTYRKEILSCGFDPQVPMFQDALTSDEDSDEESNSDSSDDDGGSYVVTTLASSDSDAGPMEAFTIAAHAGDN